MPQNAENRIPISMV